MDQIDVIEIEQADPNATLTSDIAKSLEEERSSLCICLQLVRSCLPLTAERCNESSAGVSNTVATYDTSRRGVPDNTGTLQVAVVFDGVLASISNKARGVNNTQIGGHLNAELLQRLSDIALKRTK
jgi:hypothetical protein